MKIPTHLKHKPIIAISNYDKNDAQYSENTDVVGLSIGKAQYDNKGLSLKVWRHTGKKWSRQSEEIPIHRCIDLSILFLNSLMIDTNVKCTCNELPVTVVNAGKLKDIIAYYKQNEKHLKPRLMELSNKLTDFLEMNVKNDCRIDVPMQ